MDAETIKREASEALLDLELDSTVNDVTQSGKNWCVQFSGDYGQFCDSFQNQFEHDNSPRVVREKIKKHLLGQVTQLRNKGGRRTTRKGFDDDEPKIAELFQEAISETTRAIGQAIDRTLGVTGAGIKAAGDVAETITAQTAAMLRPEPTSTEPTRARRSQKASSRKSSTKKSAGKAKPSGAARKAAAKTKRAGGAAKKAGAKKKSSRKK